MHLPEIAEDSPTFTQELEELIKERYAVNGEGRFCFQLGEINTLALMPHKEAIAAELHKLLSLFNTSKIENGYCYYKVKSVLSSSENQLIPSITLECDLIQQKKSDFHKINHLILMREVLLKKLQSSNELGKQTWEYIEDLRFINEEIIKAIRLWKSQMQAKACENEVVVYLYKNENYITKMINDNHSIIQHLNSKQPIFWSTPNPFFLTNNSQQAMPAKSINALLEILSQEKAEELKMMIESPFARAGKTSTLENELVLLRNKIEDQKVEKIKTIYKGKQEDMRASRHLPFSISINQQKIDLMTIKHDSSVKNLEKLIKIKEIEMLKELNKAKINPFQLKTEDKPSKLTSSKNQPFISKIQNLKAQIEKNIKINAHKQKKKERPKAESEIRSSTPKIKILNERQAAVEPIAKSIVEAVQSDSKSKMTRSRSTFYKQLNIQQNKVLKQEPSTKKQQNVNTIASAFSFSSISCKREAKSTSVRFNIKRSVSRKGEREKNESRQEELKEVKESLLILNQKIRQQAIKNIYTNKSRPHQQVTASRIKTNKQQSSVQQSKIEQIQAINSNNAIMTNFEDSIKKKETHIHQLKQKLIELRAKNNQTAMKAQQTPSQSSIINEKIQKQRQNLQLQQLRIREEMKKQQLKFLALKQKEYQLREAEMQQKYQLQLEKVKEQIEAKNREFQLKIAEEQRKHKQNQEKMQQIRKQSEAISLELQQKQLKQQLMEEIFKEEQLKRQKEQLQKEQKDKAEQLMEAIRQQQEKYKLQLERKAVQTFQEEKLKLNELYLALKRKNEALQNENTNRHRQLQRLQAQKEQEFQAMQALQLEIEAKEKEFALQKYLSNESPPKVETADQIQLQIMNQEQELQQLKERVKAELIQQLKRKRRQEQEEEKQYEEERQKKMAEMEEELRRVMRLQEEGLGKIEAEYKLKNEQIVKEHQQQLLIEQMAKQKMAEEAEQTLKRLQHSQPYQVDTLIGIDTGLENSPHRLKRAVSNLSADEPSKESSYFIEDKKPQQEQAAKQEQPHIEEKTVDPEVAQKPSVIPPAEISETPQIPEQNGQMSPSKYPKIESASNLATQSPTKLSPEKPTQAVKQNSQQIRQKYDALLGMISKPMKQIFMSYDEIDTYLNKFYSQLPHEVKEMIPYSRKEIESIFREKKVDVFDGFNFGLFRPKDRKFMLFGGIQCIPLIASKYGEIQIEQVYLFNKANGYQKTFLSKQIKIYEKVGYIYQKKTAEEGIYTIKFIVKVPKQNKKEHHLRDQLEIKTVLHLEENNSTDQTLVKNNCVFYMLGQALNEALTDQQKTDLAAKTDIDSKYAAKKMKEGSFSNMAVKTEPVSHSITELTIILPIKYIQTVDQPFFTLQVVQYLIKATEEHLYVAVFQEHNIAILIHKMSDTDVPPGFTLQTYLQSKFKKMEKVSDLFLFLPVWQNSKKYQYRSVVPFSYLMKTHANLVYGSIVKNKVHKGDFIFLEPPFAFLLFEITSAQVLKRIIYGHIVTPEQVLKMKRVIN